MFHPHLCLKGNLYCKIFLSTANVDYSTTLQPSMLTFPIGSVAGNTQCFGVTIINDELVEGNENFFLNLVSTNAQVTVDQTRDQATVNIIDEDSRLHFLSQYSSNIDDAFCIAGAIFVLDMSSYSAMEDQGLQTVNAVLQNGMLTQNVIVTLQTITNAQATADRKLIITY